MTKKDILRKITSRKFWIALIAFISALLVAFNVPEASISQVTAIISAFGSLVIYMLSEAKIDASRAGQDVIIEDIDQLKDAIGVDEADKVIRENTDDKKEIGFKA